MQIIQKSFNDGKFVYSWTDRKDTDEIPVREKVMYIFVTLQYITISTV